MLVVLSDHGPLICTHFMYRANLSYQQLQAYLDVLVNAELVGKRQNVDGKYEYFTTDKGAQFRESIGYALQTLRMDGSK